MPEEEFERPNSWWRIVYGLVLVTTVLVILALAAFSAFFSL